MNLLLFLSDRCNMACDYCFLSLNQGRATILYEEAAATAVHDFLDGHPGGGITVLGGEPLLHLPLVERILTVAAGRARVKVVTNGALCCPKTVGRLQELGAQLTISVDGTAASHDAHRPLRPEGPSHSEILKALEQCEKQSLSANMVVCADTAGALLPNIEALREAGFRRVSFHLNIQELWTKESLRVLKASLDAFAKYRRAVGTAIEFTHLSSFTAPTKTHDFDDVILGADGRYYACDSFFAKPYTELDGWVIGTVQSGVDWKRRQSLHDQAQTAIHEMLGNAPHYTCPRETYFLALQAGKDPAPAVRAFHAADTLLGDALATAVAA